MADGKERLGTILNAPMLHCWPIGTIRVVIGRLCRLPVKLEVMSPNATVQAYPRTRPKSTDRSQPRHLLAAELYHHKSMIRLPLDNVYLAVLH